MIDKSENYYLNNAFFSEKALYVNLFCLMFQHRGLCGRILRTTTQLRLHQEVHTPRSRGRKP